MLFVDNHTKYILVIYLIVILWHTQEYFTHVKAVNIKEGEIWAELHDYRGFLADFPICH